MTNEERLSFYIVIRDDELKEDQPGPFGMIFADIKPAVELAFKRLEGKATILKCNSVDILWSGEAFKNNDSYDDWRRTMYETIKEYL